MQPTYNYLQYWRLDRAGLIKSYWWWRKLTPLTPLPNFRVISQQLKGIVRVSPSSFYLSIAPGRVLMSDQNQALVKHILSCLSSPGPSFPSVCIIVILPCQKTLFPSGPSWPLLWLWHLSTPSSRRSMSLKSVWWCVCLIIPLSRLIFWSAFYCCDKIPEKNKKEENIHIVSWFHRCWSMVSLSCCFVLLQSKHILAEVHGGRNMSTSWQWGRRKWPKKEREKRRERAKEQKRRPGSQYSLQEHGFQWLNFLLRGPTSWKAPTPNSTVGWHPSLQHGGFVGLPQSSPLTYTRVSQHTHVCSHVNCCKNNK